MAHRSMMEMEHSDWILSGPYFAVRTAQMNRSRHALFNLLWTNLFQIVLHRPKMLLLLLLKKLNGKNWYEQI